jgi:hypothetical protein
MIKNLFTVVEKCNPYLLCESYEVNKIHVVGENSSFLMFKQPVFVKELNSCGSQYQNCHAAWQRKPPPGTLFCGRKPCRAVSG